MSQTTLAQNRLMNEHETAEVLCVEVSTLRRWRWEGRGPVFLKIESAVRYDPADIAAYLAANRRRSTSDSGKFSREKVAIDPLIVSSVITHVK